MQIHQRESKRNKCTSSLWRQPAPGSCANTCGCPSRTPFKTPSNSHRNGKTSPKRKMGIGADLLLEVEVGPDQSGLGLTEVMEEIVAIWKAMAVRPLPPPWSGPHLCRECGQPGHI
ncbi:hypothetical protein EOD39_3202 [Acipenser ruthenus]|uniref:Uncharacterized protein n=1 Tax=Acipenser ruthenus TaxID=7906 RepID=A0A444UPJ6_ACIRT|nr:hypothetical protein EOD39_3202 [Acipenser ruthenus]